MGSRVEIGARSTIPTPGYGRRCASSILNSYKGSRTSFCWWRVSETQNRGEIDQNGLLISEESRDILIGEGDTSIADREAGIMQCSELLMLVFLC